MKLIQVRAKPEMRNRLDLSEENKDYVLIGRVIIHPSKNDREGSTTEVRIYPAVKQGISGWYLVEISTWESLTEPMGARLEFSSSLSKVVETGYRYMLDEDDPVWENQREGHRIDLFVNDSYKQAREWFNRVDDG